MTLVKELRELSDSELRCGWPKDADVALRAAAEIERLEGIVQRLPKTADGVPVAGETLLYAARDAVDGYVVAVADYGENGLGYTQWVQNLYSTRAAAEAAAKAKEETR